MGRECMIRVFGLLNMGYFLFTSIREHTSLIDTSRISRMQPEARKRFATNWCSAPFVSRKPTSATVGLSPVYAI